MRSLRPYRSRLRRRSARLDVLALCGVAHPRLPRFHRSRDRRRRRGTRTRRLPCMRRCVANARVARSVDLDAGPRPRRRRTGGNTLRSCACSRDRPRGGLMNEDMHVDLSPAGRRALSVAMAELTPIQQRRMLAVIDGKGPSEIAREDGVSRQSVAESLRPAKGALLILGRDLTVTRGGEKVDIVLELLRRLTDRAFNAKKPVVVTEYGGGSHVEMVDDHQLQASIAFRLLGLVDPAPDASGAALPQTPPSELEAIEETKTTTTRRALRTRRADLTTP